MKDPLEKDLVLPSPVTRGLCDTCAKWNWEYHLTRYLPIEMRSVSFQYEDSLLKQSIHNGELAFTENVGNMAPTKWFRVSHAPYSGEYYVSEMGDHTQFEFGPLNLLLPDSFYCGMCKLLRRAAQDVQIRGPSITSIKCRFTDPGKDRNGNPDPYVLMITFRDKQLRRRFRYGLRLAFLGNEETNALTRPLAGSYQIDLDKIRKWYERCKMEHVCCYRTSQSSSWGWNCGQDTETFIFRVIDVATSQVVLAPPACRYIALRSYVWGKISPFKLNNANIIVSENNSSLDAEPYTQLHRQSLPRTIQDAIFVVQEIGERYLWVDSLCIIQDDLNDFRANIHNMGRIFSAAEVTIIAASGRDADSGLPGLYPGIRHLEPITGSIESIRLAEIEAPLALETTVWSTRGWTYQEYQLSTRTLIFTNQRVYYQCKARISGEVRPNRIWYGPHKTQFLKYISDPGSLGQYAASVEEYSTKVLTYELDVLNAFTAIMEDFSIKDGTTFCWGLPLKHFTQAMLWVNGLYYDKRTIPLKRRVCSSPSNVPFPLWSWTGWVGGVQFDHCERATSFRSNIDQTVVWPWDLGYDISAPANPFKTGILTIKVELATIDLAKIPNEDIGYCRFDEKIPASGCVECFLICTISDGYRESRSKDSIKNNHIVLVIEKYQNSVYYRAGLMRITTEIWEANPSQTKCIQLR